MNTNQIFAIISGSVFAIFFAFLSYDISGAHLDMTNKVITAGGAMLLYGFVPWMVFKTVRKIKQHLRKNKEKSASDLV